MIPQKLEVWSESSELAGIEAKGDSSSPTVTRYWVQTVTGKGV